jgi:hypothetical protein
VCSSRSCSGDRCMHAVASCNMHVGTARNAPSVAVTTAQGSKVYVLCLLAP